MYIEVIKSDNKVRWDQILSFFNFDPRSPHIIIVKYLSFTKIWNQKCFILKGVYKICIYLKKNCENISDKKLYHVTTPYCYGGLFNLSLNVKVLTFRKEFKGYSIRNGNVTEFIRFNPISLH